MATAAGRAEQDTPVRTAERRLLVGCLLALLVLGAVAGLGGRSWRWTGFQNSRHLWDWLHLLLLPFVLALLPVWRRHRRANGGTRRLMLLAAIVAAAAIALVVGGYLVPWRWTGFTGNTLWNWLELLLLPVSVAFLPIVLERRPRPTGLPLATLCCAGLAFILLVVGGYLVPWRWTGFTGNTLRDWVSLLIVPFALPATIAVVLATAEPADHAEPDDNAEGAQHAAADRGRGDPAGPADGDTPRGLGRRRATPEMSARRVRNDG